MCFSSNVLKIVFVLISTTLLAADQNYDFNDQTHLVIDPSQSKVILNLTAGGENILFFRCGQGTFINQDGQCEVPDINQPISLIYGLSDVSSCTGLNGTTEWQGSLPVGSGTGEFEIDLPSGIPATTNFTISCQTNQQVRIDTKVVQWNFTEFMLDGSYTGIFKWIGDTIHAVKYTDKPITVSTNNPQARSIDGLIPYIVISDVKPLKINDREGEFTPMKSKSCASRGYMGFDAQIQFSDTNTRPNTCVLEPNKSYYLVRMLLKKNN